MPYEGRVLSRCDMCQNERKCKVLAQNNKSWHIPDTLAFFGKFEATAPYHLCGVCQTNMESFHRSFNELAFLAKVHDDPKGSLRLCKYKRPAAPGPPLTPLKQLPNMRTTPTKSVPSNSPPTTPSPLSTNGPGKAPPTPSAKNNVPIADFGCNPQPETVGSMEQAILRVACPAYNTAGMQHRLWHTVRFDCPDNECLQNVLAELVDFFAQFFDRKVWRTIFNRVGEKMGNKFAYQQCIDEIEAEYDILHSLVLQQACNASRRKWTAMYQMFRGEVGERRVFSNGLRFPRVLHSWGKIQEAAKGCTSPLNLQGDKTHCYRLASSMIPRLLSCAPMRERMKVQQGAPIVRLDALCGVDALPLLGFSTVLPSHVTHFSISFLQYGKLCRSPHLRHLLCVYAGKDDPESLSKYLQAVMDDLLALQNGKQFLIPIDKSHTWSVTVFFTNHLLADLVALFAQRGLRSFNTSIRCYRCNAGPATCRHVGPEPSDVIEMPELAQVVFIFAWLVMNMHTDFGLHWCTNWAVRIIRLVEGQCVMHGGEVETAFYDAFANYPGLRSVGICKEAPKDLRVLGKHVDMLCKVLRNVVSHPSLQESVRLVVTSYCDLVPLVRAFKLTDAEVDQAVLCAGRLAYHFRQLWPTPNNLFPYFHMADCELERELRHVHGTLGVGVGAFVCQGVEALGHHLKLCAQHTGWCPETFLRKMFEQLELRVLTSNDLLQVWREYDDFWDPPIGQPKEPPDDNNPGPLAPPTPTSHPYIPVCRNTRSAKRARK